MATTALTTQADTPWVRESPVTMVEGESRTFSLTVVGATTVTSPVTTMYDADSSYTAGVSGSDSVSGTVITTKVIGTVKGGSSYVVNVTATVDSRTDTFLCKIEVLFPYGQGTS